ncbi:unnamed protein product [Diamesa tonsa]
MNRFEFALAQLTENESVVMKDEHIKIYDGQEKTSFEDGEIILTTHRLFWGKPGEFSRGSSILQLQHKYVSSLDEETASSFFFGKKTRLIIRLKELLPDKSPGPMDYSPNTFIKLSGPDGISTKFIQALNETVMAKVWMVNEQNTSADSNTPIPRIKQRSGIGGIEKSLKEKQKQADENISVAFQDLSKLIGMAKEMVDISKSISNKIRERRSDESEDETIKFKSLLLSLGIDDPVTKDNFTNNNEYLRGLGNEICQSMLDPITASGGMLTIAEVYCRINRARGLELVSPEDVLNACKLINGVMKLRQYPSGAMILQLENHDDDKVAEEIEQQCNLKGCLGIEEFARNTNISVLLAHERFLIAERAGKVCRDESIEGLVFYPNLFMNKAN